MSSLNKYAMYRYVCKNCLKTFTDKEKHDDWFCFKCGLDLVRFPGD